MAFTVSN